MQEQYSLQDLGNVHLLGIGGVGVSAVARLMLARGLSVSGTDAKDLPVLHDLRAAGARISVGYAAENLGDADTVVISSIIKAGNPEYDEAVSRGLRILHRSQGLAATMEGHRVVTVAGTHGKTTTTALIAYMLRAAGISPTFAVGANIASLGVNAEYGQGRVFVAEADESDASFLNYRPDVTVITNIEADHLDHYGSVEAVHQAFFEFASLLPESGLLICCADDPGSQALAVRMRHERPDLRVQTYGFAENADRRLDDPHPRGNRFACSLEWGSGEEIDLEIALPGNHNLLNASAGFAVGLDCGLEPEVAIAGLGAFTGAARRFDFRGEAGGVRVYDDYAHHPTEVQAALHAARAVAGDGSVHVLFQPHLFSRTQEFHADFAAALSQADSVHVLEIYPARETPIPGVSSELVTRDLTTEGGLVSLQEAAGVLARSAKPGDVVMTIGAGDVTEQAARILGALEERQGS